MVFFLGCLYYDAFKKEVINNEENDEFNNDNSFDRDDYDYASVYMLFYISSAQDA